eukprot:gnl/TRDRNA2_/TRDRNA2_126158_c0_seq3.p1 gnl/TRDRNA2_/TRDRNA2_126158_c0~~gnl/TRDRNA2_/TRDRNA2_126158_c0_seq3.p1  ORF type:complete len:276 (+),score=35.04 gnl/TRDRNA2_/TRDRNA2_126158_c0_seq3:95-922(+)
MGNEQSLASQTHSTNAVPEDDSVIVPSSDDPNSNGNKVFLNVYDLSSKLVSYNALFTGHLKFGGAFHVGVEVYGTEWYYTREGIVCNKQAPRQHFVHVYNSSLDMGRTAKTPAEVSDLILQYQRHGWVGENYHDLRNNCCNFSNEFCMHLVGQRIPAWVDRVPKLAVSLGLSHLLVDSGVSQSEHSHSEASQSEPSQSEPSRSEPSHSAADHALAAERPGMSDQGSVIKQKQQPPSCLDPEPSSVIEQQQQQQQLQRSDTNQQRDGGPTGPRLLR